MRKLNNHQLMPVGFLIALMLAAGACSAQVAPTPQPSPASMDMAELRPMVEDAVKAALAEAVPPPGDEISRQELKDIMAEAIAAEPFPWRGTRLELGVSYGVYGFAGGEAVDEALSAADRAMYARKRDRNGAAE